MASDSITIKKDAYEPKWQRRSGFPTPHKKSESTTTYNKFDRG